MMRRNGAHSDTPCSDLDTFPGWLREQGQPACAQSLEGEGVAILRSALMERAAFQAIHLTGEVPRQTEPKGAAALNVTAIAQEVMERLKVEENAA